MAIQVKERIRVAAGRQGGPMEASKAVAVRDPGQPPAAPSIQPPANFLAVIAAAAADTACDVGKMQALLDMQRQIEEREAEKSWTRDFIALQRVLPAIRRDGKIEIFAKDGSGARPAVGRPQQSTPYATYPNIMKVCKPLMDEHGFTIASWIEPEPGGARILVVTQLDHIEHHKRTSRFPLPAETSGSKNNVQGWGSSQQYGMRYNAIALLNIISEDPRDQDRNGYEGNLKPAAGGGFTEVENVPKLSPAQVHELKLIIEDCGVTEGNFCVKYEIERVADLPQNLLEPAKAALNAHKAQRAQNAGGAQRDR